MNHPDAYKTLLGPTNGDYREKGSKFLSYAYPCENEAQLKDLIQLLKKEHPSARHFCYGAVLGTEHPDERSSDAGEPSGTAGLPILNQILSRELRNVAVIVVRHFGGTKLGKSGLIKAYKESSQLALYQSNETTKINTRFISISYTYEATSQVMQAVERNPLWCIDDQVFTEQCLLTLSVPKSEVDKALSSFANVQGVQASHR